MGYPWKGLYWKREVPVSQGEDFHSQAKLPTIYELESNDFPCCCVLPSCALINWLEPFHSQECGSISNFPCSLTRNITSHSMENLTFHSLLRWKMIILPTLITKLTHIVLRGWENALFEIRSERVKFMQRLQHLQRVGPLQNIKKKIEKYFFAATSYRYKSSFVARPEGQCVVRCSLWPVAPGRPCWDSRIWSRLSQSAAWNPRKTRYNLSR